MNRGLSILADLEPRDLLNAERDYLTSPRSTENLIITGSILLAIVLATIIVVAYQRKQKRRRHRYHHSYRRPGEEPARSSSRGGFFLGWFKRKRRKKRRRSTERPMNPTLAQTGGLPPARDEETSWPPKA